MTDKTGILRTIKRFEADSLGVLLSYSDIEAEYNDWVRRGEPAHHIFTHIRILLKFLKDVDSDCPLEDPELIAKRPKQLPKARFDQEELV